MHYYYNLYLSNLDLNYPNLNIQLKIYTKDSFHSFGIPLYRNTDLLVPPEPFPSDPLYILAARERRRTAGSRGIDCAGHVAVLLASNQIVSCCETGDESAVEAVTCADAIDYMLVEQCLLHAVRLTLAHQQAALTAAFDHRRIDIGTDLLNRFVQRLASGQELQLGLVRHKDGY